MSIHQSYLPVRLDEVDMNILDHLVNMEVDESGDDEHPSDLTDPALFERMIEENRLDSFRVFGTYVWFEVGEDPIVAECLVDESTKIFGQQPIM